VIGLVNWKGEKGGRVGGGERGEGGCGVANYTYGECSKREGRGVRGGWGGGGVKSSGRVTGLKGGLGRSNSGAGRGCGQPIVNTQCSCWFLGERWQTVFGGGGRDLLVAGGGKVGGSNACGERNPFSERGNPA